MKRRRRRAKCYYCGDVFGGSNLHQDHKVPRHAGGTSKPSNVVWACNICNAIKGRRSIKKARLSLLLRRIGWPRFSHKQIKWLRKSGFDVSPIDNGILAFEGRKMTAKQYKAALLKIRLSQRKAAKFLKIGARTSQGYAMGESPVPGPIAKLLRLMLRLNLKPEDVR